MRTRNFIGETAYVTKQIPATFDAEGFMALTWTKAGGIQQQPQLGVSHANIDVEDLETGFTAGAKGAGTGNSSSMAFRENLTSAGEMDPGQQIIRDQSDDQEGPLCIMLVKGTGPNRTPQVGDIARFAEGYAHSYLENQGNVSTHKGFTAGFKQNSLTVEAALTADVAGVTSEPIGFDAQ